jgi:DNA-binding NarL/FixJ family response regulator
MNRRKPSGHGSVEGVRAFRFVHEGQELLVISQSVRPAPASVLTPAQFDVARAISRGASNAEIARRRGASVRTVANQVASILLRLGATSRAQVALKLALVDLGSGEDRSDKAGR